MPAASFELLPTDSGLVAQKFALQSGFGSRQQLCESRESCLNGCDRRFS